MLRDEIVDSRSIRHSATVSAASNKVLVAVKAERGICKTALTWALTHVIRSSDCITLLAVYSGEKTAKHYNIFRDLTVIYYAFKTKTFCHLYAFVREKGENGEVSSVDPGAIFTELQKTENGRAMTMERVISSLVRLGCDLGKYNDSYSIELKKIIGSARDEEVQSIVLKRYGRDAYRIFRLLSRTDGFLVGRLGL
ncbi:hypothetical protein K1719_023232 [Acacia pycnantha]|nr:hypothetical protein K1719_023232 [Acacia pycnantha]